MNGYEVAWAPRESVISVPYQFSGVAMGYPVQSHGNALKAHGRHTIARHGTTWELLRKPVKR